MLGAALSSAALRPGADLLGGAAQLVLAVRVVAALWGCAAAQCIREGYRTAEAMV